MFYGLITKTELDNIILDVTGTLGNGSNNNAHLLLSETAMTETRYGDTPDLTKSSGYGLFQFDHIGFIDVIQRTSSKNKRLVKNRWGVDIDEVSIKELQYSPLLSAIFARLKYLITPGAIPLTIQGRAAYWKKWYNSTLGKGTVEHYLTLNSKPRFVA